MAHLDSETIRHALEVARRQGVTEVELTWGDTSFRAQLAPSPPRAAVVVPGEPSSAADDIRAIVAPLVGYFQKGVPELAIGSAVVKGDVVGIVSALGLANDVEAPFDGKVVELLVGDNDPVQFGQPLAKVRVTP